MTVAFTMTTFWVFAIIVSIIAEIATVGLASIWFCFGGVAALLVSFATDSIVIQMAVFIGVSLVMLVFTRPLALKFLNAKRIKTNLEAIVGSEVRVTEAVDNVKGTGKALRNGLEWIARAEDEHEQFQMDEIACVARVDGVKLILEKVPETAALALG